MEHISNSYLNAKNDVFFSSFCLQIWYSHGHALQLSCNEVEIVWCRSKACQGTYWLSERVRPTDWWWLSWAAIYIAPAIHDSCPPPVCRSLSARSPIYLSISICWVTTLGQPAVIPPNNHSHFFSARLKVLILKKKYLPYCLFTLLCICVTPWLSQWECYLRSHFLSRRSMDSRLEAADFRHLITPAFAPHS